ncbi:MAG: hypothetical protein K0V04_21995 [Deltaproteobacteria bacterium]|nr:hypothetical protein [Deltaproteobacteria bacterium]
MNDAETTLTRMLAAEARGELSDEEGRELQAMLEARLREVDPQPPPPWGYAWRQLQGRIRGQRRVVTLAATGIAAAVAALVTFSVHGSPNPPLVLGGLAVAAMALIYAGFAAWRRAVARGRIGHDDGTALFVAMRDELDREIVQLRWGGLALTFVVVTGLLALAATLGLSRPPAMFVVTAGVVVVVLVVRELLVTLPRLVEQRRKLE